MTHSANHTSIQANHYLCHADLPQTQTSETDLLVVAAKNQDLNSQLSTPTKPDCYF